MIKVYLAGHMPKENEVDWRDEIIQRLSDNPSIYFLVPEDSKLTPLENLSIRHDATATRDEMFLNKCDVAVVNLDLELGSCLGAMWEFGYLYSKQIPIILWNHHPGMSRTHFLEHKASVVVKTIGELTHLLSYLSAELE